MALAAKHMWFGHSYISLSEAIIYFFKKTRRSLQIMRRIKKELLPRQPAPSGMQEKEKALVLNPAPFWFLDQQMANLSPRHHHKGKENNNTQTEIARITLFPDLQNPLQ